MRKTLIAVLLIAAVCACLLTGCAKKCTGHADENNDGKCDVCGADMPYSVEITNKEAAALFETKTLQLLANKAPANAKITWTSSNSEIATVSGEGLVTGVKEGTAKIRAAVKDDVFDEVTVTVKGTVVNTAVNSDNFNWSGLYQDNAVIATNGKVNSFAVFTGAASKYYVATAYAKVTDPDASDTWSRVGISHYNAADNSYYGLQLSGGPSFNARKTVTMIITNGDVQWGMVTDRSQVWNQHNLAAVDFNRVKLTTVRNGSDYYAYINDMLYYVERGMADFDGADTLPVLNVGNCVSEFSEMSVSYGQSSVSAFLQTADSPMFYGSFDDVAVNADGSISFTGAAEGTCPLNAKDHGAKSLGAAAILEAGVEGTVEFDLKIDAFGSRDALPALAVTINRYDGAFAEARSLVIGQNKAGWTGWNSNGNLNDGIGSGGEQYRLDGAEARLEEGKTYHVVFTRLMSAEGQDTKLTITDSEGNVLLEHTHGWRDGYTGRASVSFLSRDLDCTITNIAIRSADAS